MPDEIVLELSYADAAQVPEAFKGLYSEKDGVHNLNLGMFKGLKTEADVNNINRALTNERTAHKDMKAKWGQFFGDRKVEDVQAMLDRIPELELAASGKVDDEKINQIVESRTRAKLTPLERQVASLTAGLAERDATINEYKASETRRTIHDDVRGFAGKSKVVDSAVEDVLMLAERVFEVAEDGKVVTKEGINGVTPGVSPEVWLQEMQQKRPHWWPPSSGGGSKGGGGAGGFGNGADNPFSHAGWNVTKQGQMVRENAERATQMAKSAGTTIGGLRPPAPAK